MISTSRTQYEALLDCARKAWWSRFYPKTLTGGPVDGLESVRMNLPLSTGTYTHSALADLLRRSSPHDAVASACARYRAEAAARGLDAELNEDVAFVLDEQCALLAGLVFAFARVGLPRLLEEYDIEAVEREEETVLGGSVRFLARPDAVLRRKDDGLRFLLSFKTVGGYNKAWAKRFDYDIQTMSEVVAVEARLHEKLGGVLVIGLDKCKRMPDEDAEGNVVRYRNRSPLIYGYKFDGNPPLEPAAYDYQYTRKKGWRRFNVWEERFPFKAVEHGCTEGENVRDLGLSPVEYWVNWLPQEVVEQQIVTLPPILRDEEQVAAWTEQVVAREQDASFAAEEVIQQTSRWNAAFPQTYAACYRFGPCPFLAACWTHNVSTDPIGSGLYRARTPHHTTEVEGGR